MSTTQQIKKALQDAIRVSTEADAGCGEPTFSVNGWLLYDRVNAVIAMIPDPDKLVSFFVNGQAHTLRAGDISYALIVALAFPHADPRTVYTVTHVVGSEGGSLIPRSTVKLVEGMRFDVAFTGNA